MTELELLPRKRCREIFEQVERAARAAGAEETEVMLGVRAGALTRFANNAIHQNVAERRCWLSVRTLLDHRTARAETNRLDPAAIQAVVEQAVAATRSREPDPEMLPVAEPHEITPVERFCRSTAESTPAGRAQAVSEAIRMVEAASQTAAGIYATSQWAESLLNSRGVFLYHTETLAQFSITAMAEDSSGWAKASFPDGGRIDPPALARRASEKAARSRAPREAPPGRYTVILEPSAVQDLLGQMFYDFSGTAIRDKRSFLTGRLGEKLFGDNIAIYDDAYHPLQSGPPFDAEGVPRKRLRLADRGVAAEVAYSRRTARLEGAEPTGHGFPLPNDMGEAPMNIVIEGGSASLDEMIRSTARGILVTRLWYIREVDPYEKIMTGMTRDGTFLIEDGEVVCGLRNFRFNQSLIELLRNVEALSPAGRASGEEAIDMVVPAMKVRDFRFTEVTKF